MALNRKKSTVLEIKCRNIDIYRFCQHCNKQVSEKTFKEHRHLYFHEEKWLFSRKDPELDVETRHCHHDSGNDLSALYHFLSVPDNSSLKMDSEISINPENVPFDGVLASI